MDLGQFSIANGSFWDGDRVVGVRDDSQLESFVVVRERVAKVSDDQLGVQRMACR